MASDGLQRFASDNYAGICPEAWAATAEVNRSHAPANGDDLWTARAWSQVLMYAIGPQVVASTMLSRFGSLHWAAFRNRTVYCASKWALEGLTKAMAVELGPRGIRVNTLCPTFIETPLTRPFLAEPTFRAPRWSWTAGGRPNERSASAHRPSVSRNAARSALNRSCASQNGVWPMPS